MSLSSSLLFPGHSSPTPNTRKVKDSSFESCPRPPVASMPYSTSAKTSPNPWVPSCLPSLRPFPWTQYHSPSVYCCFSSWFSQYSHRGPCHHDPGLWSLDLLLSTKSCSHPWSLAMPATPLSTNMSTPCPSAPDLSPKDQPVTDCSCPLVPSGPLTCGPHSLYGVL